MEDVSFNFDFILVPETALTVNNTKESLYFEQQGELHESLGIILEHWTTKKKKIVSWYYNMLPFVFFWSISVSQNPDHEPISNPAFSTTDHGPEFVHTICSNTGKTQTSRKIKLVGARLVHMGEKLFPWSQGWPLAFNCNQEDRHSFFPYRPPVW